MATTSNFSWATPDDTANVKDGASAIRSLGTAIDTTVATMVPKTVVDAKGDIIAATAADTVSRLAVGANGTTLVADSSEATGLKWATPSSGAKTWQQSATGSLTGSSITVSNLTGQDILVSWQDWSASVNSVQLRYRLNGNSGSIYRVQTSDATETSARAVGAIEGNVTSFAFVYIPAASSTIQIKTAISNLYPWAIKEPNAVTSIEFFPSSGSFDAGNYYVWELK